MASDSLLEAALKVLNVPDAAVKAAYTNEAVALWNSRQITRVLPLTASGSLPSPPDVPARMAVSEPEGCVTQETLPDVP